MDAGGGMDAVGGMDAAGAGGSGSGGDCGGLPGRGSCELRRLRAQLREGRWESPAFDGVRWAEDYETGLLMARELQAAGMPPAHVFVAGSGREWDPTPPSAPLQPNRRANEPEAEL